MECDCEVEVDVDSTPDVYEIKDRKARKEHKCTECNRTIWPGEEYEHVKGKWEHGWDHFKTCSDCLSMRTVFFNMYFFGEIWSCLSETISDWNYEVPEDCLVELTPRARAKVCEIIEKGWEE